MNIVKKVGFLTILVALNMPVSGQGMFGFMGGAGYTMGYKGYVTPTAEGYYMARLSHHFYAGGSISFQRYSLLNDKGVDTANAVYGDLISIRQKSSYLFLCGKLDMGIGYRNLYHVHLSAGPGFNIGGTQWYNQWAPLWTSASGPYGEHVEALNTSYNIKGVITRVTLGVSERIPTLGYWNIMLSQEFTMIPTSLTNGGQAINANYFALTVGIMHKYPQVRVEY